MDFWFVTSIYWYFGFTFLLWLLSYGVMRKQRINADTIGRYPRTSRRPGNASGQWLDCIFFWCVNRKTWVPNPDLVIWQIRPRPFQVTRRFTPRNAFFFTITPWDSSAFQFLSDQNSQSALTRASSDWLSCRQNQLFLFFYWHSVSHRLPSDSKPEEVWHKLFLIG